MFQIICSDISVIRKSQKNNRHSVKEKEILFL